VDTLGPANDLFPANEHIKGVGELGVVCARHGVEGTHSQGVPASSAVD